MQSPAAGMQYHLPLRQLIYDSTGRGFGTVKRVYVVPGEILCTFIYIRTYGGMGVRWGCCVGGLVGDCPGRGTHGWGI